MLYLCYELDPFLKKKKLFWQMSCVEKDPTKDNQQ